MDVEPASGRAHEPPEELDASAVLIPLGYFRRNDFWCGVDCSDTGVNYGWWTQMLPGERQRKNKGLVGILPVTAAASAVEHCD